MNILNQKTKYQITNPKAIKNFYYIMIKEFVQSQIDVIEERCKEIKPLVEIRCLTYNHEKYLKDALEGFVMQKTNFSFVAIVHDDASTDNTANILRKYAEKYPDIIFPIFEKENQYSKRNGSLRRIMNSACDVTGAKYIALCEGDDYWIDPLKLQKQVDFLETHPDFTMCFTKANVISEESSLPVNIYDHLEEKEYTPDEIMRRWTIPTASIIMRKEIFDKIPRDPNFYVGDNIIALTNARSGKLFCLGDKTTVYRRQANGWINSTGRLEGTRKIILHNKAVLENFKDLNLDSLKKLNSQISAKYFAISLRKGKFPIDIFKIGFQSNRGYFPLYLSYFLIKKTLFNRSRKN